MFIEDIALITLSTPYKETTRYIRPACIPIGPKFKDFGWVKLKIFQFGWNMSNYGGVDSVVIHPRNLWIPDILLYNRSDNVQILTFFIPSF